MNLRQYLPESLQDVSAETAITAGAVGLGTIATLANLIVGDKTEAATFLLLTLFGAYKSGELSSERLQERKQQITSAFFKPAPPVRTRPTPPAAEADTNRPKML